MVERLGEKRKGRRERIEKESRERIIEKRERVKTTIWREGRPLLDPTLRCSHCFVKSSGYNNFELKHQNLVFTSLYYAVLKNVMVWNSMKKYVPLVKQNAIKLEVFILGGQRIDQKRKKGWGRERIEKGNRERIEIERKETKGNWVNNLKRRLRNIDNCLCLLFSFLKAPCFSWVPK